MTLQKCPLYFGWLSLSARKDGKLNERHDKSVPYILDGSVLLPIIMVSITKVSPIFWMAQSYANNYGKHYKSVPYILDGTVFLPGNMVSITKVPPIF